MIRSEWMKYGNKRPEALKQAIKSNDPIPDVNGKNLEIANTRDNLQAIDNFVKSKDATFILTLKNKKEVMSNQIGKSPLFGGKGKGAGATGNTAKGESLQCLYLQAVINEPSSKQFTYFTPELLKKYYSGIKVDKSFNEIMSSEPEWHYSAYVTAKYLIDKGFVNRTHVFHRGSSEMKAIYDMKKAAFKNDEKPMMNDDKWNPGDIWAIKRNLNLKEVLDDSSVSALNSSLKTAYDKRLIVGISLKQINSLKKRAKHSEYNLKQSELATHNYSKSILKSDRTNSTFWSFKGGYIFFDNTKKMDVRAPTSMGALNVEIQGSGARGGRAGYSAILYAAEKYLNAKLLTNNELKTKARSLLSGNNEKEAKELYLKAYSIHPDISWEDFWEELKTSTVDRIHANLGATEIIFAVNKASPKAADEFVSYLVNTAGSKTGDSSVYVKVEAA